MQGRQLPRGGAPCALPLSPQGSLMCVDGVGLCVGQRGGQCVPGPQVTEGHMVCRGQIGIGCQVTGGQGGVLPECIGAGPVPFLASGHSDPEPWGVRWTYSMTMGVSVGTTLGPPPLFEFAPRCFDGMPLTGGEPRGVLCRLYQGGGMGLGEHAGEQIATRPGHVGYVFRWCCHCTVIMIRAHPTKPIPTNAPDQTKNHVVLHVESPTKPYRILCSRCESAWCVWLGHGALTRCYQLTLLAVCRYNIVLPIITGRGVKYTHNDHINPTVPTHSGGPGLRRIPQGRHPSLEVIP
jgi:hypothetical protein